VSKEPAAAEKGTGEEQPAPRGPGKIVWLLVLLAFGGTGAAVPFLLPEKAPTHANEQTRPEVPEDHPVTSEETVSVPFGEVVVNLDEGRMNRYLRLRIAVLCAKDEEKTVTEAIATKSAVVKNWLLSHLSDKTLEEIRGKAGQNMLRREILAQFNEALFADRRDRIFDVLFEEFNVQ
jgi:flagellar protein FliL